MKLSKKESKEKIDFLINFAIKEKDNNNPFIYDYVLLSFKLAKKINYRIPSRIHQKVCKNCYCIRDSNNTITRVENLVKNNKTQKYLKLHCKNCNYIKKINLSK